MNAEHVVYTQNGRFFSLTKKRNPVLAAVQMNPNDVMENMSDIRQVKSAGYFLCGVSRIVRFKEKVGWWLPEPGRE